MSKKLSQIGELRLIEEIRGRFSGAGKRGVIAGIGDDAAVLRGDTRKLLATTDMMVEGVHFDLGFVTPFQLGFKLISVNVSDIYAMGGIPCHALLDIALAGDVEKAFLDCFFDGVGEAADLYGVSIVGGDVSSSLKGLVVAATLIGYAEKPIMRKGAKPGDMIYVTGPLGESAAGLCLLKRIGRPVKMKRNDNINGPLKWDVMGPLIKRHLMPIARKPEASVLKHATSMIDISDGLFIDLRRLAKESGVGARIHKEKVPISDETEKAALFLGLDPLGLAASGGEDYELLFTAPKGKKVDAVCIGEITGKGYVIVDERGRVRKIPAKGYQHFGDKGKT